MTIDQFIQLLASVTLFELMVSIGLGVTFADVVGVARDWRLVARAALANYVCVPAAAVGLLLLFRPHTQVPAEFHLVAAGFRIAAVCPGAPYGPPFTGMARGNVVVAVGLMALLAGSSALLAPVLLRLLLPLTSGNERLQIPVGKMVGTLMLAQFLPLWIGLAVRQWRPALADALNRPARLVSLALNLLTLGVILSAQYGLRAVPDARPGAGGFGLGPAGVCRPAFAGQTATGGHNAMSRSRRALGQVVLALSTPGSGSARQGRADAGGRTRRQGGVTQSPAQIATALTGGPLGRKLL
jgi:hypothetical protein